MNACASWVRIPIRTRRTTQKSMDTQGSPRGLARSAVKFRSESVFLFLGVLGMQWEDQAVEYIDSVDRDIPKCGTLYFRFAHVLTRFRNCGKLRAWAKGLR